MTEDELKLWERYRQGDDVAREELILAYLYLVKAWAKRITRFANWANQEDLVEEGIIGLIKAIERFDLETGVEFKYFAKDYIRGTIFDSSELTRGLARQQEEFYRKIKYVDSVLTRTLQRNPTIEEVADETGLSVEQIMFAIDAMGVAFAGELPDVQEPAAVGRVEFPRQEQAAIIQDVLARLSEREQSIVVDYYWEDQSHDDIAQSHGLSVSNVIKIRQRAVKKLRQLLGSERTGMFDENERSGRRLEETQAHSLDRERVDLVLRTPARQVHAGQSRCSSEAVLHLR
jgi:RNA polymerase sigma factor (sigma-70 family)